MKDHLIMNIDDYVNNTAVAMNSSSSANMTTTTSTTSSLPTSITAAAATTGIIGAQKAIEKHLKLLSSVNDVASCVELIKEILNDTHIYVFGEFIDNEKLAKFAEESGEVKGYFDLLKIFAYGKYSDYSETLHPKISDMMRNKLRHLTIVSLAYKCKTIPYKVLLDELCIANLRELEDLIIDVIYLNIINGKMDQANSCLEVNSTISRDLEHTQLDIMTNVLNSWCNNCDQLLANIDKQTKQANNYKNDYITSKIDLEQQISNLRKTIKMNVNHEQTDEIDTCQNLSTSTMNKSSPGGRGLQSNANAFINKIERMKRTFRFSNTNNVTSGTGAGLTANGAPPTTAASTVGATGGGLRGSNVGSANNL